MRIDSFRKCEYEGGCNNLARVDHVKNHIVKRARLCETHHRRKHPRTTLHWKWKGYFKKCIVCGWDGPCDFHRKDEQGAYSKENVISVCPNCHRLHHFRIKIIDSNINQ